MAPTDLPSERTTLRGAHLHRLPCQLPACDTRSSLEALGHRAHHAQRAGEILCRADDRRATDARELMLTRYTQPEAELKLLLERLKIALPPQPPPKITAAQAAVATPV